MNILKSKWGVAAIAGVLVIGGGFAAVNVANAQVEPVAVVSTVQPTVAPIVVPTSDPVTVAPAPIVIPEPAPVVAPEPAPVVEPEPYVEPAPAPVSDGIPAGAWPLPWIPSADPNNGQGGNYDFTGCSGASTFNGVPYCLG